MNKSPRRWLQFSLGTLLIAFTATAVWIGWLAAAVKRQREAVEEIKDAGGQVVYRHELSATGIRSVNATLPGPKWLRKIVGDDYFQTPEAVYVVSGRATDKTLAQLPKLPYLETVEVMGQFTPAGLSQLAALNNLKDLHVSAASLADDDLAILGQMRQLETLAIDCDRVTDDGLASLTGLRQLQSLRLGCSVSDRALPKLAALRQLRTLTCITHPKVSRPLSEPTTIQFWNVELHDILDYLEDLHLAHFRFAPKAVSKKGLDADRVVITATHKGILLSDALDQMLRPHGLAWTCDDDAIVISTAAAVDKGRQGLNDLKKALPNLKVTADW